MPNEDSYTGSPKIPGSSSRSKYRLSRRQIHESASSSPSKIPSMSGKSDADTNPSSQNHMELAHVIGMTVQTRHGAAIHPTQPWIAYPAGAVVLIYDIQLNTCIKSFNSASRSNDSLASPATSKHFPGQTHHVARNISCVNFNPDGSILAIGESGHQPRIFLWHVDTDTLYKRCLLGHKYGVSCMAFPPKIERELSPSIFVSCGVPQDGQIFLWNLETLERLASVRVVFPIHSIDFQASGTSFVTVGPNQVRFWDCEGLGVIPKGTASNSSQVSLIHQQTLQSRPGILGEHKGASFVAVACEKQSSMNSEFVSSYTYALTDKGILAAFNARGVLEKWVDLKMPEGSTLVYTTDYLIAAGANETIRLFEPKTLKYILTFPKPDSLQEKKPLTASNILSVVWQSTPLGGRCAAFHSDRSLVIWELRGTKQVGKYRTVHNHSDSVWKILPYMYRIQQEHVPHSFYPQDRCQFVTCSADGSIRLWHVSNDMGCSRFLNKSTYLPSKQTKAQEDESNSKILSPMDDNLVEKRPELLTLAANQAMTLYSCGDKSGCLYILDAKWQILSALDAHTSEIMTIAFSHDDKEREEQTFLATGSRDRLIHVFHVPRPNEPLSFDLLQTLNDHSGTVTAIVFANQGHILISASSDKSILFRRLDSTSDLKFVTYQTISIKSTILDLQTDPSEQFVVALTQDKRLCFYSLPEGKLVRSFKPLSGEDKSSSALSSVTRMRIDPSGLYIVLACSDKSVRLLDFHTGRQLARVVGHGDQITDAVIDPLSGNVITTSADGCIFLWTLSPVIRRRIYMSCVKETDTQQTILAHSSASEKLSPKHEPPEASVDENIPSLEKFLPVTEHDLPIWARSASELPSHTKSASEPTPDINMKDTKQEVISNAIIAPEARGKWADRIPSSGMIKLYSHEDISDAIIVNVTSSGASNRKYSLDAGGLSPDKIPKNELIQSLSAQSSREREDTMVLGHVKSKSTEFVEPTEALAEPIHVLSSDMQAALLLEEKDIPDTQIDVSFASVDDVHSEARVVGSSAPLKTNNELPGSISESEPLHLADRTDDTLSSIVIHDLQSEKSMSEADEVSEILDDEKATLDNTIVNPITPQMPTSLISMSDLENRQDTNERMTTALDAVTRRSSSRNSLNSSISLDITDCHADPSLSQDGSATPISLLKKKKEEASNKMQQLRQQLTSLGLFLPSSSSDRRNDSTVEDFKPENQTFENQHDVQDHLGLGASSTQDNDSISNSVLYQLSDADLSMFRLLADKTADALTRFEPENESCNAQQNSILKTVAYVQDRLQTALPSQGKPLSDTKHDLWDSEFVKSLLEAYSDKLVDLVKEKLSQSSMPGRLVKD